MGIKIVCGYPIMPHTYASPEASTHQIHLDLYNIYTFM